MAGASNQTNKFAIAHEREASMLRQLTELALSGQPLPGARGLSRMVGLKGGCGGGRVLTRLANAGHIRVEGWGDNKTVQILATQLSLSRGDARRSMETILATVAQISGLTIADIVGPRRTKLYLRPRGLVAMLSREAGWSYPAIGRVLRRDHSTAIHACERAAEMLSTDPLFGRMHRRAVEALEGLPAPSFTIPARKAPVPRIVLASPPAPPPAVKTGPGEYTPRNALPPPMLSEPVAAAPDEVKDRVSAAFSNSGFLAALAREHPERCAA